ncbi:type II toxin-antitoxin system VapC family toxin [Paraburkholderia silvatlantica]|uniref:Nucleic-acid-binding protein n=1 Tax=Paraburkholderia silvatlantica TaxID=321895 RepID=A0ABR6FHQ8_9BURK|nr:type II toxin-antitoxin system VapC family toxin [Paraburkholderia silvatlantica]MBB2926642.1 putative nucleic-acid-binding protein [Paraburkholderia silvatlantica]PVY37724.1 putative nucleic-acid-binding protein [Paraburkholderia silvatlantica]PXW42687.1 putative nucleic-acid-binding protein [Paraburkholderia silvatlantica]
MKIAVDTNVLLRAIVADDEEHADKATALLDTADMVAVSLQTLCELVWVLRSAYKVAKPDIASAIRALLDTRNVVANRPAAEAGLALLELGGDFADGVIAWDGRFLGGEQFISFDKKAVSLLTKQGHSATLL